MAKTISKGLIYNHGDYKSATTAKFKALPEQVKKAILGKDYVEPTVTVEEPEQD